MNGRTIYKQSSSSQHKEQLDKFLTNLLSDASTGNVSVVPRASFSSSGHLNYNNESFKYYIKQEEIRFTDIDTLINFKYKLIKPIKVKIIKDNNGVIGEIEELNLYSFGNDEFEVLRELNEDVTYLFEDLISMKDENLGKFPRKWKFLLKQYIAFAK